MNSKILNIFLIFLLLFVVFQKPQNSISTDNTSPISIQTQKKEISLGKTVSVNLKNNTEKPIAFNFECPKPQLQAFKIQNGEETLLNAETKLDCSKNSISSKYRTIVKANSQNKIDLEFHSNQLFKELGTYKLKAQYSLNGESYNLESNEFEIVQVGFFRKIWLNLFYRPIYNALIGIISLVPGQNLGISIIVLTLLIRILLFHPNQKAIDGQKKMQLIQPKLEAIRKKHKDNQQIMAMETMKVWQEAKVNPFSSCLPMLIQFPILISIFYVVQAGINPDKQIFLYEFLTNIRLEDIQTQLFGLLDMTERNQFVLPVIVGLLQMVQLKLNLPKKDKKDLTQNESVQQNMVYFMPALIAVFTASLPSGVGIYWATTTVFAIGQQIYTNKKHS